MQQPLVKDFFDENTNTFSYVVADLATRQCAIIDSVLDYDAASATTKTTNADLIVDYVLAQKLQSTMDFRNPCTCGPYDCGSIFKI